MAPRVEKKVVSPETALFGIDLGVGKRKEKLTQSEVTEVVKSLSPKKRFELLTNLLHELQKDQNLTEKELKERNEVAIKHLALSDTRAESLIYKSPALWGPGKIELIPGTEDLYPPVLGFAPVTVKGRKQTKEIARSLRELGADTAIRILLEGESKVLPEFPLTALVLNKLDYLKLPAQRNSEDKIEINSRYMNLLDQFRKPGGYEVFENLSLTLLKPYLGASTEILREDPKISQDVAKKVIEIMKEFPESEELRKKTEADLTTLLLLKEAAKKFDPKSLPSNARAVWDNYNDSINPKGEFFNLKDTTWDTFTSPVNIAFTVAALIPGYLGGRLAWGGAQFGFEQLALPTLRTVLRLAAYESFNAGKPYAGTLARALFGLSPRTGAALAATTGVSLGVESLAFNLVNDSMQGELLFNDKQWVHRTLLMSGTFGVVKIGGIAATSALGGPLYATELGKYIKNITNKPIRALAEQLVVRGSIDTASLLVAGAIEHKYYHGEVSSFMNAFGDRLIHTAFSSLALRGVDVSVSKLSPPLAEMLIEWARTKRPRAGFNLSDLATNQLNSILGVIPPEIAKEMFLRGTDATKELIVKLHDLVEAAKGREGPDLWLKRLSLTPEELEVHRKSQQTKDKSKLSLQTKEVSREVSSQGLKDIASHVDTEVSSEGAFSSVIDRILKTNPPIESTSIIYQRLLQFLDQYKQTDPNSREQAPANGDIRSLMTELQFIAETGIIPDSPLNVDKLLKDQYSLNDKPLLAKFLRQNPSFLANSNQPATPPILVINCSSARGGEYLEDYVQPDSRDLQLLVGAGLVSEVIILTDPVSWRSGNLTRVIGGARFDPGTPFNYPINERAVLDLTPNVSVLGSVSMYGTAETNSADPGIWVFLKHGSTSARFTRDVIPRLVWRQMQGHVNPDVLEPVRQESPPQKGEAPQTTVGGTRSPEANTIEILEGANFKRVSSLEEFNLWLDPKNTQFLTDVPTLISTIANQSVDLFGPSTKGWHLGQAKGIGRNPQEISQRLHLINWAKTLAESKSGVAASDLQLYIPLYRTFYFAESGDHMVFAVPKTQPTDSKLIGISPDNSAPHRYFPGGASGMFIEKAFHEFVNTLPNVKSAGLVYLDPWKGPSEKLVQIKLDYTQMPNWQKNVSTGLMGAPYLLNRALVLKGDLTSPEKLSDALTTFVEATPGEIYVSVKSLNAPFNHSVTVRRPESKATSSQLPNSNAASPSGNGIAESKPTTSGPKKPRPTPREREMMAQASPLPVGIRRPARATPVAEPVPSDSKATTSPVVSISVGGMKNLPRVTFNDLDLVLKKAGFTNTRNASSHRIYTKPGHDSVSVSYRAGDLLPSTVKKFLSDSGITVEQFRELLKK